MAGGLGRPLVRVLGTDPYATARQPMPDPDLAANEARASTLGHISKLG